MSIRTNAFVFLAVVAASLFGCAVDGTGSAGKVEQALTCSDRGVRSCKIHDAQADCLVAPGYAVLDVYHVTIGWDDGTTTELDAPSKVTGKSGSGTYVSLFSSGWKGVWSFDDSAYYGKSTFATKSVTTTCGYPKCAGTTRCIADKAPTGGN